MTSAVYSRGKADSTYFERSMYDDDANYFASAMINHYDSATPPHDQFSSSPSPLASPYEPASPYSTQFFPSPNPYKPYTYLDDKEYSQTMIKDEPALNPCVYNDVQMSAYSPKHGHLPSVVEDIKPELYENPTLLPPLSPDEISQFLHQPAEYDLYEPESETVEEIRREVNKRCACCFQRGWHQHQYHDTDFDEGYSTGSSPSTPGRVHSPPYKNPDLLPDRDGLFRSKYNSDGNSDDESRDLDTIYRGEKPKKRMNRGQAKNSKLLWQFMVDVMVNPRYRHLADWVDREEGVFRIIQSAKVAEMWGREKGNPDMNYEKMSRAMRFLRINGYFVFPPKVHRRRLYFKFGPKIQKYLRAQKRHYGL